MTLHPVGIIIAFCVLGAASSTLYWMLHPQLSRSAKIAQSASTHASTMAGNVLVVFSADINSLVLMALAARMAKRQLAKLVAIYVIEVPYTLPIEAELPEQERAALDALSTAEAIGRKEGIEVEQRTIRDRLLSTAIMRAASEENVSLIVMGAYREHGYAGAPLAKAIDFIMTRSSTDVLVGVSSLNTKSMLQLTATEMAAEKGKTAR
jgi:nucleotide-binding universal stress UspA family protein